MKAYRVRVYVNGSSPVVLPGAKDDLGAFYIETRPASGQGYTATPQKRIYVKPDALRALPAGQDADLELIEPLDTRAF